MCVFFLGPTQARRQHVAEKQRWSHGARLCSQPVQAEQVGPVVQIGDSAQRLHARATESADDESKRAAETHRQDVLHQSAKPASAWRACHRYDNHRFPALQGPKDFLRQGNQLVLQKGEA